VLHSIILFDNRGGPCSRPDLPFAKSTVPAGLQNMSPAAYPAAVRGATPSSSGSDQRRVATAVEADSGIVTLSSFAVVYQTDVDVTPDDEECADAQATTTMFLAEFLSNSFDYAPEIKFQNLTVSHVDCLGNPLRIMIGGSTIFDPDSTPMPTTKDMDLMVEIAFRQPAVETLLILLQASVAGPFSYVTNASYIPAAFPGPDASNPDFGSSSSEPESLKPAFIVLIVVAALVILSLILRYLVFVREHDRRETRCDNDGCLPASQSKDDAGLHDNSFEATAHTTSNDDDSKTMSDFR
jgi:hypothetical protein